MVEDQLGDDDMWWVFEYEGSRRRRIHYIVSKLTQENIVKLKLDGLCVFKQYLRLGL